MGRRRDGYDMPDETQGPGLGTDCVEAGSREDTVAGLPRLASPWMGLVTPTPDPCAGSLNAEISDAARARMGARRQLTPWPVATGAVVPGGVGSVC